MKIVTILGARSQFIKAGSLGCEILKQREAGADKNKIFNAFTKHSKLNIEHSKLDLYGGGQDSQSIVSFLIQKN